MIQGRGWSLTLVFLVWSCHPGASPSSPDRAPRTSGSSTVEFSSDAFKLSAGPRAPNVILVTIDTLRADFISSYGGPARTPNLDQLAKRGWLFKNCFSTSMLTNPAHISIMTSLFPKDHGVYDNQSGVQDGLPTLATAMAKRGYRTLAVISFPHLNPATSNLGQGFEHIIEANKPQRSAKESISEALGLLDKLNFGDRFFLWVHLVDPHTPYRESHSHATRATLPVRDQPMRRVRQAAPGFQKTNKWFRWAMQTFKTTHPLVNRYIAEIERADAGIGQLLDGLYQRGYGSNTAYFITSDHGENLGERDLYFHHGGLYRETLHVPLITYIPTETPAVIDEFVQTVDIAPTVLRAISARPLTPSRGRSLFDTARGRTPGRTYVFSEHMHQQMVAVRSKEGTLIRHLKNGAQFPSYPMRKGNNEFYTTTTDPAERHQILEETPVKQQLQHQLEEYLNESYSFKPRPASSVDLSSLRALGYLD